MTNILVLVGSLRADSINRKLADAAIHHAPEGVTPTVYEGIVDLPFYNEDIDGDTRRPPRSRSGRPSPTPTGCCSSRPSTTARCRPC